MRAVLTGLSLLAATTASAANQAIIRTRFSQGLAYYEAKDYVRALANRKLTPLTADEKAQIRRFYLAGMQFFANDEYAKAISEWEKILEIDPTNESVQRNIDEARQRLRQLNNR